MQDRRGFLKMLGFGSAALVPGCVVGIDLAASGEDLTAFNFACECGGNLVARVPKAVGAVVKLECGCGKKWELKWMGDHFTTGCGVKVEQDQFEAGKSWEASFGRGYE